MKKKPWKRLSQSDSEAVMRLVDEYQSSIKRIIVSVLKGQWPDAVDDILQDTYEEICRQLNLIEEAENRRAYVCKIAARLAIQAHRKLGRDLPLDEDVPAPEDLSFNLDTILPNRDCPWPIWRWGQDGRLVLSGPAKTDSQTNSAAQTPSYWAAW